MSTQNSTALAETKRKDITSKVLAKVEAFEASGEIKLPKGYSAANALKSAYLILLETKNRDNKYALEHCTQESIANSLLKMVTMGLSVMKKQGNFIMYGNTLAFEQEYAGNIVLAKRFGDLKTIKANAIFEGDNFTFEVDSATGCRKIIKHEQTLESIGSKDLKGAYAVFELNNGVKDVEIMNIQQIRDAWNQGSMKGNSPAHKNFPDQMACKSVINRACKLLIRGSDDSILYADEEEGKIDVTDSDVKYEVKTKANKQSLDFSAAEDAEVEEVSSNQETDYDNEESHEEESNQEIKPDGPGF